MYYVGRITHVMSIISVSQLHFLAKKNAELASRSPKLHKHEGTCTVLRSPTVYSL